MGILRWMLSAIAILIRALVMLPFKRMRVWRSAEGPVCPDTEVKLHAQLQFRLSFREQGTVTWQGGGVPATGEGEEFVTRFSTPGEKVITATWVSNVLGGATTSHVVRVEAGDPAAFGGYDLQLGDRDATGSQPDPVYGAVIRTSAAGDRLPAAGAVGFVRQLQRDLSRAGFAIVGVDDGDFGRTTAWGVREFQSYAKMPRIAVAALPQGGGAEVLTSIENPQCYSGPISGVLNAQTRCLIQRWTENDWRCPVVIDAWNMTTVDGSTVRMRDTVHTPNLWRHDALTSTAPRVYARDMSGYYEIPPARAGEELFVVGEYSTYLSWSGPASVPPRHTWPEAEVLPDSLVGVPLAELSQDERAVFKAIRAVSEVECLGFFDSVNAYDNAFISVGPCHWTFGIVGNPMEEGELCGYLAYLRHADEDAFHRAFRQFGIEIDESWLDSAGVPNGGPLWMASQRKYRGWVRVQQEDGSFQRLALTEAEGNYFKSWHWFYRFVMAGRTIPGYQRCMWDMARIRLRDVLSTPWGPGVPDVPSPYGTRPATIGDVYTSERSVASLLRWHIRYPSGIVSGGQPGAGLSSAFARATIPSSAGDPSGWTDAHENDLMQGIVDQVTSMPASADEFKTSMSLVRNWPRWVTTGNTRGYQLDPAIGPLAVTRNSFPALDSSAFSGLPPAN